MNDDGVQVRLFIGVMVDRSAGLEALVDSVGAGFGLDAAAEDDELGDIGRLRLVGVVGDYGAEVGDVDGGGLADFVEGGGGGFVGAEGSDGGEGDYCAENGAV